MVDFKTLVWGDGILRDVKTIYFRYLDQMYFCLMVSDAKFLKSSFNQDNTLSKTHEGKTSLSNIFLHAETPQSQTKF